MTYLTICSFFLFQLFWLSWKVIKTFVDPNTRKKVIILGSNYKKVLGDLFEPDQLQCKYGGESTYEHSPDVFVEGYNDVEPPSDAEESDVTVDESLLENKEPEGTQLEDQAEESEDDEDEFQDASG